MTPKEKAQDLFDKYFQLVSYPTPNWRNVTKQCALIAVDEIMITIGWDKMKLGVDRDNYWQEVKEEIEKL
jgi:hypothetical protein